MQSPTPEKIRALLDSASLTAYAAARVVGIDARQIEKALAGTGKLSPSKWALINITLSASARKAMPAPVAP